MNNPPSLFAMSNELFANGFTIRLCIPGIDNGSAVYLQSTIDRGTIAEADALASKIHEQLSQTVLLTRIDF